MSGAYVPYHLRQNKAVDRQVFIDLLTRLNRFTPISKYSYISFGGPYLEDFKLIHGYFGNNKLVSLENDAIAYARQQFNMPLSCITAINMDSGDFISDYAAQSNSIFWLDYADARKTREHIQEFESLISKLYENDIVRITLNANPEALYRSGQRDIYNKVETIEYVQNKRLDKLMHRLGDYLPQDINCEQMTFEGLPLVLVNALKFAANNALSGRAIDNLYFQPLLICRYSDSSHQMITLTGIILSRNECKRFFHETELRKWKLASLTWDVCHQIMVPALTIREKLHIDQLLPRYSSKQLYRKLKFQFDKDEDKSIRILDNYKKYYRYFPNFNRVVL